MSPPKLLKITTIAIPTPLMTQMDQMLAMIEISNRSEWVRNAVNAYMDRLKKYQFLYTETVALYLDLYGTVPPTTFLPCQQENTSVFTTNIPAEDIKLIKTTIAGHITHSQTEFIRWAIFEYVETSLQSMYNRLIAEKQDRNRKQECAKLITNTCLYHAGCRATGFTGICKAYQATTEEKKA